MIIQSFMMALKSIGSNKMRSFLTMLGVIIGVFAVVVLVSIAQGSTDYVAATIESLGTNLLTVNIRTQRNNLTLQDLTDLQAQNAGIIEEIAPSISNSKTAKAGLNQYSTSVVGTVPGYDVIRNLPVASGRFLKQPDIDNRSEVAVIGVDVATNLFDSTDVLGQTFSIDGRTYTIVGILEKKGSSMMGSTDNQVVIPFTLAERVFNSPGIRQFYVSSTTPETVDAAQAIIENFLDTALTTTASQRNSRSFQPYNVFNQASLLETVSSTTQMLTLMLAGIAGISLLVGGIGIMNIMLVSVSERTREIGIRKAIGAQRSNILIQFLIEAIVISGLGGLIGLLAALIALKILGPILTIDLGISPFVAQASLLFSMAVGIIFGIYPANKASKLHPIEALRYE